MSLSGYAEPGRSTLGFFVPVTTELYNLKVLAAVVRLRGRRDRGSCRLAVSGGTCLEERLL